MGGIAKGLRKLLGVMGIFSILIVVMVYGYIYQLISYTWVKLLKQYSHSSFHCSSLYFTTQTLPLFFFFFFFFNKLKVRAATGFITILALLQWSGIKLAIAQGYVRINMYPSHNQFHQSRNQWTNTYHPLWLTPTLVGIEFSWPNRTSGKSFCHIPDINNAVFQQQSFHMYFTVLVRRKCHLIYVWNRSVACLSI